MPVVGTMWARGGGVAAHPDNAYRLLREQQQLVLVFPEGTQGHRARPTRERYQLRRFGRGGFVEIAMRAGVPVIPIAVVGAEESMPIVFKSPTARQAARPPLLPDHRQHARCSARSGSSATSRPSSSCACSPPVHFDVAARPGALLAQPGDGRGRAHPRARSRRRSTTCCARAAASGSASAWACASSSPGSARSGAAASRRRSRSDPDVEVIVGLDTDEPTVAARAHRVRARRLRATRSSPASCRPRRSTRSCTRSSSSTPRA